jgi:hypothetical protein
MITFVLRIIVIECFSTRGFPLEEASEHCFLSIKLLSSIVLSHYYYLQYFYFQIL